MTAAKRSAPAHERWSVHLALIATQTGFALFPIFGKLALTSIPPLVIAAFRAVSAAALLELARRTLRHAQISQADRGRVFLYGLLGVSFNQILFILGLSLTTAINTTILMAAIPAFTLFIAVVLGHETLTLAPVGGVVLAGSGALLLLNAQHFDWHSRYFLGNLLLLGNAVSYSFYLVLSRPILARYSALTIVSQIFLYGAIPIVLFCAPSLGGFRPGRVTALSWGSLAAVIVLCTVMPYLANCWALARTHASRVALYVFLQPLLASVLAIRVLHESLGARTVAAAALILAGLVVSVATKRPGTVPVP